MPERNARIEIERGQGVRARVERGEPGGRAPRDAGVAGESVGVVPSAVFAVPQGGGLSVDDLPDGLIDELLAGVGGREDMFGSDGLIRRLTRRLVERALEVELTDHLGYEHGQAPPGGAGNSRNGRTERRC